MFLGADWDASLWELKDGRIFPSFSYGVSTKTIYIEKPKDILKLKKYYKGDNIVIFGDDPTTSFNPYEYNPADKNTWGTFTATELAGLSINKESRKLIFDISVIKSQVYFADGGTYFQRFLGVMYGELASLEKDRWYYEITNIERPIFNVVKGGLISGLSFNLEKNSDKGTIQSAVLANTISGRADLNNLQFSNIKLEPATEIGYEKKPAYAGIIASTMEDVMSISNITITNCEIEINNISDTLYIGAIAGKNNTTSISYVKINNVIVNGLTITANDKISGELNVGGMFGETSRKYDFKNSRVIDSSLNVGLTADQEISVGGFVGNAQGNSTVHRIGENTNLTTVTITIGEAATTYAGLLFGKVGTLITNDGDNPSFKGTIQNADDNGTKKPTTLVIGGAAGRAGNATIFGMSANLTVDDLATKTYQVKGENGQTTETIISSVGSVFGYVVGEATIGEGNNNNGIKYYKDITITGSDSSESNNAITIGGLIGRSTGKLTLSNSGYYGDLTIRYTATTRYIGGLVGRAEGELKLENVEFNKDTAEGVTTGSIKIERVDGANDEDSSTTYVGGLVGFAKEKATITNSSVTGDILFPATLEDKTPIAIGGNSTVNVGLIAGVLSNKGENAIENAQVGGDILFGNGTIQGKINAGALVGTFNGGTISGSYAWGNVELKNATLLNGGKFEIDVLTVGGLVGNVGGATKIADNYSLTSMYITRLASLDKTNINALVGTKSSSVEATKDKDGKETNFYCHQINLATDTIGQNLYYKSGIAAWFDPILTKLRGFITGLNAEKGSKLNPSAYSGETEEGKYYYLSSSSINESKDLKGHLVGDGKILSSKNLTPFNLITGAVSGIRFVVTSTKEAQNAGRVRGNEFEEKYLPSGVAYENKGIIFAVNVYAKGFKGLDSSFGNVLYSFNAGIAQYNSGLISDSGVVFNVKSLVSICGTPGTPTNGNEGTPGVIKNSYATGAVHEKAEYALAADCRQLTRGVIQNCYSAIDSKNCIYQDFVAENCFYDNNAAKNAYNDSTFGLSLTGKSTDYLSTVTTDSTDILGNLTGNNNWKQDFRVNFGYPYLGNNAYSGFSYMEEYTGGGSQKASVSPEEISDSQEYQPRLVYKKDYDDDDSWKLYEIYLGDKIGTYSHYIWINNGEYKFVLLSTTTPKYFTHSGNPTISSSILISGKDVTIDFKIDTKKVSIEVYSVKITDDPCVQIPNAGKLAQLQTHRTFSFDDGEFNSWAQKYILLSNIDLSAARLESWSPIGKGTNNGTKQAFTGCFDGNSYKIIEIPGMSEDNTHLGFFGYVSGKGIVKNCGFIYRGKATIIQNGGNDAGGVVGQLDGNATVDNVSSSGAIIDIKTTTNSFGGLVGAAVGSSSITNSTNFNTVTTKVSPANNAGGIVGYLNVSGGSVKNCNNYGKIENTSRAGGIVGQLVSGSVSNCSNYNVITATTSVSGIANYSQWGDAEKGQGSSGDIHRSGDESGQRYKAGDMEWVVTKWKYLGSIEYTLYFKGEEIYKDTYNDLSSVQTKLKISSFTSTRFIGYCELTIQYFSSALVGLPVDQYVFVGISYNLREKLSQTKDFSDCVDFGYEILSNLSQVGENFNYTSKTGKNIVLKRLPDDLLIQSVGDNQNISVYIKYKDGATTSYFGPTMSLPGGNICRIYDSDPEGSQSLWSNSTSKVTPTDGVYNIYTAEDFAWIAKEINAGNISNETINICNDIDLTGKVWVPIKNYDYESRELTASQHEIPLPTTLVFSCKLNKEPAIWSLELEKGYKIEIKCVMELDNNNEEKYYFTIKVGDNLPVDFDPISNLSEKGYYLKYSYKEFTYTWERESLLQATFKISLDFSNTFYFNNYKIFGLGKGAYDYNTTNPIFTKESDNIYSGNVYSHTGGASLIESKEFVPTTLDGENFTNPQKIGNYWYAYYDDEISGGAQAGTYAFLFFKSSDSIITTDLSDLCANNLFSAYGYIDVTLTDDYQAIYYDSEQKIFFYAKKGGWKYEKVTTSN